MNILYLGPNASEWAQMNRPVSLAGAKWARGFLAALSKQSSLFVVSHSHEKCWPKGNVFWRGYDAKLFSQGWPCEPVNYPCLPFVREIWWALAYAIKAIKIIRRQKIDVVLTYNCCDPWHRAGIRIIKIFVRKVLIMPIILDGNDPRKDEWRWIASTAKYCDGFIPLSWWVYKNLPKHIQGKYLYHFDGGADKWCGTEVKVKCEQRRKTLVHTGALDQWRGLNFMIDVVRKLTARHQDVKFIFCGKTSEMGLAEAFKNSPQVELPGVVSEEEMVRICNSADVFLNVRDPNHPDNILNYPSKLPHYLSFGRPVVSTRLQSLSPDYDEVVNFALDDSVEKYVEKVEEVLSWSDERKIQEYNIIKGWFEKRKSWDAMVLGLVGWLEGQLGE